MKSILAIILVSISLIFCGCQSTETQEETVVEWEHTTQTSITPPSLLFSGPTPAVDVPEETVEVVETSEETVEEDEVFVPTQENLEILRESSDSLHRLLASFYDGDVRKDADGRIIEVKDSEFKTEFHHNDNGEVSFTIWQLRQLMGIGPGEPTIMWFRLHDSENGEGLVAEIDGMQAEAVSLR